MQAVDARVAPPQRSPLEAALGIDGLTGFRYRGWTEFLYWLAGLCTCSLTFILAYWAPETAAALRYDQCDDMADADFVLVRTEAEVRLCAVEQVQEVSAAEWGRSCAGFVRRRLRLRVSGCV
jgi:hypothetical protein